MTDLENLVGSWLPLPDVAERLGLDVGQVRRLVQERALIALRFGERGVRGVPEKFLMETERGWQVVPALAGTVVVLADSGFSDEEAVRWLFTPDESLASLGTGVPPRTPIDALVGGHKTEIRRRAQSLAF
ncbi:Rv2175c family DNA-binding protein [Actinotalea sp.]|uniref:Rv2175c family DNA-binding protein n=1 Tax=Actinotalea sp. TaxID=1872145 RepID=UPI003569EB53